MDIAMRISIAVGVVLGSFWLAGSAEAEKVKFSPKAFQVFGGMEEEASSQSVAYSEDSVPESMRSRTIAFSSSLVPGSITRHS